MSGRKNVLPPYHLITDGDMSADVTSGEVNIQYLDNAAIELSWTGTAVGPIYVQGSVSGDTWTNITLTTSVAAAGSADSALIDLNQISCSLIRVFFDRTSGTGTLNAYITVKEL